MKMWQPETFLELLRSYPKGGDFWSKSRRTVRIIRVFYWPDMAKARSGQGVTIAVMTEITGLALSARGYIFVKKEAKSLVSSLGIGSPNLQVVLAAPAIKFLNENDLKAARHFLKNPPKGLIKPLW